MPATATAMTLATLAIAGIPPLAGFFSKDEILAAVFSRAHGSPLASATLLGIPGSTVLYAVYGVGILTALLTAIYMTRMLLFTFYGDNRTGEAEQEALHEAPAVMTVPVVVLALLTVAGGWLNLPALIPVGPVGVLEKWLEPVTGASSRALSGAGHLDHATELVLVGVAIGVALLGIGFAAVRYRQPGAEQSAATKDTSLLARAYGVDALVDALIVRPVQAFARVVLDRGIDRTVDRGFSAGGSLLSRTATLMGARLQDGDVGKYAWMLAAGALALIAALTLT